MTNDASDIIAELNRLHRRRADLRARETQLADAGENDPASDAWKTAAIVAASAECEFEAALVEAWPALDRLLREADQWRARESETQEALQAIGEEFGVNGGEPRVDGIRRVLAEKEKALALAGETLVKLDRTNADLNDAALLRGAVDAHEALAPFAAVAEHDIGEDESDTDLFRPISGKNARAPRLTVGDLRRAKAAIAPPLSTTKEA